MSNKKKRSELYQMCLEKCYQNMDDLVKAGRLAPGWQRDREAVRKLKKAAKVYAKNHEYILRGETPPGRVKYLERLKQAQAEIVQGNQQPADVNTTKTEDSE